MTNQVGGLSSRTIPATFINSDIGPDEKRERYQLLRSGALSLLYITPERLNPERLKEPREAQWLLSQRPKYLVIDEAHLVSHWGKGFRPDYGRIGDIRRALGNPPVLAFTATAGVRTQQKIKEAMGIPDATTFVTGVDRPNITMARVKEGSDSERIRMLVRMARGLREGKMLIFVPTIKIGEQVSSDLLAEGVEAPFYNSKLGAVEREMLQARFEGRQEPAARLMVATSAFGLGVDIPDIRIVAHWQHPGDVESYFQELGRSGRDNSPSLALLFTRGTADKGLLEWMARKEAERLVQNDSAQFLSSTMEAIGEINAISSSSDRCFREALSTALEGPDERARRSIASWILARVLSKRPKVQRAKACCDFCTPEVVADIRSGTISGRL